MVLLLKCNLGTSGANLISKVKDMLIDRVNSRKWHLLRVKVLDDRPVQVDGVVAHHLLIELVIVRRSGHHQGLAAAG